MSTTNYDSRTADKFVVRLPEGLRDQIDAAAITDDRSMNSVIVQAVKQYLDAQNRQELLLNALASAVSVENDRANQISETGESVNHPRDIPVVSRARSLIASLVVCGDMRVNEARQLLNSLASAGATDAKSMAVGKPQVDPRDLFVKLNPTGAYEAELEMERGGFVDHRTHAEYLIFLAGYRAANPDQAERTPEDTSAVAQSMHIDDRVKMIAAEPAFLTVVFKLPSLSEAQPLIAKFPYGQKALGTEAVVFGLSTGNLLEGDV